MNSMFMFYDSSAKKKPDTKPGFFNQDHAFS